MPLSVAVANREVLPDGSNFLGHHRAGLSYSGTRGSSERQRLVCVLCHLLRRLKKTGVVITHEEEMNPKVPRAAGFK